MAARVRARFALSWFAVLAIGAVFATSAAYADRRYFLMSYTVPDEPVGESEIEMWLTARSGKQDPDEAPSYDARTEFERVLIPRLTAAAYLNFSRPAGGKWSFDSPSLEFIYRPLEEGRRIAEPALYLEITESGSELELEPKLLLAHEDAHLVAATNLIGEFEFRHDDEERLPGGAVLRNGAAAELSAGFAWRFGKAVALGVEARGRSEYPNFGARAASLVSAGPCLNLAVGEGQLTIGVFPQLGGFPRTSGRRNLDEFERTQVRAILGMEL